MTEKITNKLPMDITIYDLFHNELSKFKAITITNKAQLSASTSSDIKKGGVPVTGATFMKLTNNLLPGYKMDVIVIPENEDNDEIVAKEIEIFNTILENWNDRAKKIIWNSLAENDEGVVINPPTHLDPNLVDLNFSLMVTNQPNNIETFSLDLDAFDDSDIGL